MRWHREISKICAVQNSVWGDTCTDTLAQNVPADGGCLSGGALGSWELEVGENFFLL